MFSIIKFYFEAFAIVILLFPMKGNTEIEPDCLTPDNKLGACIDVRHCVTIMTALVNHDHLTNPIIAKYLRESQCGIEIASQRVCCNINDIDFGDEVATGMSSTPGRFSNDTSVPKSMSDIQTCGKLEKNETPLKWLAELWFKIETHGRTTNEAKCLGTLISHKHILVPAHCVESLPENIALDFVELRGKEYTASKIFVHASYNSPKFANDIAIIELDKELKDISMDPICLPSTQYDTNDTAPALAVEKRTSSALKFAHAKYISQHQCNLLFKGRNISHLSGQYCASIQSNNVNPFVGAVLLHATRDRQYTVKGFASTAIKTDAALDENKPYVFTDIGYHLNWIQTAIDNEQQPLGTVSGSKLRSCGVSNVEGFCVKFEDCSKYRDATIPLSPQTWNQIRCYRNAEIESSLNEVDGNEICCPANYINTKNETNPQIDERFSIKRGIDLLDMENCGGELDPSRRIVGGSKTELLEFPFVTLMKYKIGNLFKFTCGSSLISERYVLTCAHCISQLPSGYKLVAVRLGEHDLSSELDCNTEDDEVPRCNPPIQDIGVEKLIPHELYNTPRYANDIGLVRLSKAPDMTKGIVPICLPVSNEFQKVITDKYTVAGFGFTENGMDSKVLLKALMPKVSKEICQSNHTSINVLAAGHACYGGQGIVDACKGDSGNPLFNYVNIKGRIRAVQFGMVAAGHSQCGKAQASGFPGIYTDINYYLNWILDNLEESER